MTTFERDYRTIENDASEATVILKERKARLEKLEREGKAEKNGFRRQCIAQEYARLSREYDELDALV